MSPETEDDPVSAARMPEPEVTPVMAGAGLADAYKTSLGLRLRYYGPHRR